MNPIIKKAADTLFESQLSALQEQIELYQSDASVESSLALSRLLKEVKDLLVIIEGQLPGTEEIDIDDLEEGITDGESVSAEAATKYVDQVEEHPTQNQPKPAGKQPESNDEDAMAMLANMEAEQSTADEEMDDDEAMAMLANMDEAPKAEDEEMSDDEAMAMLANMDEAPKAEDEEMSDDEAMAMLANMDEAPKAEDEEMGDDEAMALLASMDDAPKAGPVDEEMSDDAAMALLAGMDAPSAASNEPKSSDDEALAMLEGLGGMDASGGSVAATSPTPSPAPAPESAASIEEDIGEIEEFAGSEFGSDPEMIADFMNNADELMETLDEQILNLEQDPNNTETIEEIFRAAHTLKGASGMFGYKAIERVMHKMENYFDLIRKKKRTATPETVDVIFKAFDILGKLLEGVKAGSPSGVKTAPIVKDLMQVCDGTYKGSSSQSALPADPVASDGEEAVKGEPKDPKKKAEQSTIRVDLNRLDILVNLVGELVIDRTRFMNIEEEIRANNPQLEVSNNMTETVQLFGRHMNEIQDIIMKVRMVPIGNAFNKFNRIIRDIARNLNKKIDLQIFGEDTELDKTLVESIGDPLVHLIRNACDHGCEDPETRIAAGKKPNAKVKLSARQEGNQIIITIEDDGAGINAEKIKEKGIERGLIKADDQLSDRDIFSLIFEAGFSTAEKVTNISGRGVGMDVVKRQISKLKGLIDINSKVGKGTTITIQLPLTLAIVQSLLIQSGGDVFAVPLSAVVESIRIAPSEIKKVGDSEVIKRRDMVLPLLYLDEALELSQRANNVWYAKERSATQKKKDARRADRRDERLYVVVVGAADKRFGLVVDSLLNQQEMVIKPMGKVMADIPCIAGGAILGNGEVVLVLDVAELESLFRNKTRQQNLAA